MKKTRSGDFVCYSLNLANYLTHRGFRLVGVGENKKNPDLKVFYFADCPRLQMEMKKYLKEFRERKANQELEGNLPT